MAFDVLLRGGLVIDGTGAPAFAADVATRDGRIAAVGDLGAAEATTVIDASDKVVCPGLIDAHAHSDWCCLLSDEHTVVKLANIRQGVTTEVSGNCGFSPFPAPPIRRPHTDTERKPGRDAGSQAFTRRFASLADYRTELASTPMVTNLAPLVGHGALRIAAMGYDNRAPSDDDLSTMQRLLAEAMDDGAFGVSAGLALVPGTYATTEEIIEVARVAGRAGRLYTVHMRNEGADVVASIEESLRIGREADVWVQISHHKVGPRPNWGLSNKTLPLIEAARAGGTDLLIDVYPYTATSNGLMQALPRWVTEGGPAAIRRLRDPSVVERMEQELPNPSPYGPMLIAACGARPEAEGCRIGELAADAGRSEIRFVAELLAEDPSTMVITFGMDEDEVRTIGSQPYALVGSDGLPYPGKQHPRASGTFALLLGQAARGERDANLPDTIHRMTGLTAERFGLSDRGAVAPAKVADLVVLDPTTVRERSTYDDPWLTPVGVEHVLVQGQLVIRDGADTGMRVGQVLTAS